MLLKPSENLSPNTLAFETAPLIKSTGFREYDARWWFGHPGSAQPPELNLMGVQALGMGLGTLLHELGTKPEVVTGHDFRAYSMAVKIALVQGLMAAGCTVHDIGLALSPMAYFAQFALDVAAVAMVTASHNDNGWTGVKMGAERPVTFGPDEMTRLKEIVLAGKYEYRDGGSYRFVENFRDRYLADLAARPKIKRKLKVVAACGNGTAGAFAPTLLEALGFDGDGDRCGVVGNNGKEIFADKIGVMLARDLSRLHPNATFVVDVKSTGLFATDPELRARGAKADYWKTGHSYIKRRVTDLKALAGFEKSGHFFFNAPVGRGYDDGLLTAIQVIEMLDRNPGKSMADLYAELPRTWGSPTMSPHCDDEKKYAVVERVTARFQQMAQAGEPLIGGKIRDLVTLNGVRVTVEDGTWGL